MWTQEKQDIAEQLGEEIVATVNEVMDTLPKNLTKDNLTVFSNACEQIDTICTKAFDEAKRRGIRDLFCCWRKILIPFWKFGGNWENAYAKGFTWLDFLNTILEEGGVDIRHDSKPELSFYQSDTKLFCIRLVDED